MLKGREVRCFMFSKNASWLASGYENVGIWYFMFENDAQPAIAQGEDLVVPQILESEDIFENEKGSPNSLHS